MLAPRLAKRFLLALVVSFLALLLVYMAAPFPAWLFLLSVPVAAGLTVAYWRTFRRTTICPTCRGSGKITVRRGRELLTDDCYSCDGEGRVPLQSY